MTDFLKIAKSIVVHFAHICANGVETVNMQCWIVNKMHIQIMFSMDRPYIPLYIEYKSWRKALMECLSTHNTNWVAELPAFPTSGSCWLINS